MSNPKQSLPLVLTILLSIFTIQGQANTRLPGFVQSSYFNEQVVTFRWRPQIRVQINAPSPERFDGTKPVGLVFYALPNGNTIEQTAGKRITQGEDWHFDIQHIAAQTRFVRQQVTDYNLITIYLETEQLSWPAWKAQHADYASIIKRLVEHVKSYFADYQPFLILSGHSGGGRFVFSFLDGYDQIPQEVRRICFLDSDYGYDDAYGAKLAQWLKADSNHFLSVLAYNDSVALYNGQPVVSPTGGTWYRSRLMQRYLAQHFTFTTREDEQFIQHSALGGRVQFFLKKNPERKILHTVQVERNGFIHTLLSGSPLEEANYQYFGQRAYSEWIQDKAIVPPPFQIPIRSPQAMTGSQFMEFVKNMTFEEREQAILNELLTGNVPYFLRQAKTLTATFNDSHGQPHQVEYQVFPDYLSIGADSDYCRIPMGPITAQKAADFYGTTMPTRKLVDHIYQNAEIKLAPVTYTPVGNANETVQKFVEHNAAIEAQLKAAHAQLGQLIGGIKKDVVISNKITDPLRPNHVVIYGWHQLNGQPIQPLTNIHINTYVDYSHGIRYLAAQVMVDGETKTLQEILKDAVQYKIFSDEDGPMQQPSYLSDSTLPDQPKSFGLKCQAAGQVRLFLQPAAKADQYRLLASHDGLHFDSLTTFSGSEITLQNLAPDSILYVKLQSQNSAGASAPTEVLAVLPQMADTARILLVYGYDRPYSGNSYDFIRQHAQALFNARYEFDSVTNEAITSGLIDLQDYSAIDYILGNESTADETFSSAEQTALAQFLKAGGRLFVSGSEIAWDLDYKGSAADREFFHAYLKATYAADAPGNKAGVYYAARGTADNIFADLTHISFDNGTHGTINVKYADAINPTGGSQSALQYLNVSQYNIAGITYQGVFKNGSKPGKLVYLGFPFETVYPQQTRDELMDRTMSFLLARPTNLALSQNPLPLRYALSPNFPNPFNASTQFTFQIPKSDWAEVTLFNARGQLVRTWTFKSLSPGTYQIVWDGTDQHNIPVASGSYFYRLRTSRFAQTRRMVLIR